MNADEYIKTIAKTVVNAYSPYKQVLDVEPIIHNMGGQVVTERDLDTLCDGTVAKNGNGFIIRISADEEGYQKQFTLARGIGHAILHMGYKISPAVWKKFKDKEYIRFNSIESEYQANKFAVALLEKRERW